MLKICRGRPPRTLSSYTHLCILSYPHTPILCILSCLAIIPITPHPHHRSNHAFLADLIEDSDFDYEPTLFIPSILFISPSHLNSHVYLRRSSKRTQNQILSRQFLHFHSQTILIPIFTYFYPILSAYFSLILALIIA
jgi:hypothetical protein